MLKGLHGEKGVSLTELLVGIGLMAVVSLVASQLLTTSGTQIRRTVHEQEVTMSLTRLSLALKRNLSTAVLLRAAPADAGSPTSNSTIDSNGTVQYTAGVGPAAAGGNYGRIMTDFDSTLRFVPIGDNIIRTIAVFQRESSKSILSASNNLLEGVGIFWQFPTPTTPGAVYIQQQNNFGIHAVAPVQSGAFFDGLVELKVDDPILNTRNPNNNEVLKISFTVKARQWFGQGVGARSWCASNHIVAGEAGCENSVSYKDITRVIEVYFKNAVMGTSVFEANVNNDIYDRLYGPLYFFDFSFARAW